ncbi:MAG: hypothetical protein JO287_14300 [Pseudonocardiales bacterium]|nr:hypothetical protein [Pseudonocardiales bacterium]
MCRFVWVIRSSWCSTSMGVVSCWSFLVSEACRVVADYEVIARLEVTAVFGHVLFAMRCPAPLRARRPLLRLDRSERAYCQRAQHDQRAHARHQQLARLH